MTDRPVIVWLRQDLRLSDHPALAAAVDSGRPIVPVYILDDETPGEWTLGGASRWWLHRALASLTADIEMRGGRLVLRRGRFVDSLLELAAETGASAIHATRGYEPYIVKAERALKAQADRRGIALRRFAGAQLYEPEAICTRENQPFKVFTPFWRACLAAPPPADPLPAPHRLPVPATFPRSDDLAGWGLLPSRPDWAAGLRETWQPGEAGAHRRLSDFLADAVANYADGRDRPDRPGTSLLSAHLHFGEISPRQCWHAARAAATQAPNIARGVASFLRELGWREFSTHLLLHFPHISDAPFRPEFARFPWREPESYADDLARWQKGRTGFPIVDAGMRQLWHTGYMHNRVRMIAASLLTKHLRIPWQEGARWFWDTLVDADLANNSASWQWVAGCGADAAPYFRIFNPMLQGAKFDPNGDYVRRWVPELARLPAAHIHTPWEAPAAVLAAAGVIIGDTYPAPMIDHAKARTAALAAYAAVKST